MNIFQYQNLRKKNYFEGWYFRFTSQNKNIAVIFAITKNQENPHAFLQVFHDQSKNCDYITFSLDAFHYDYGSDTVHIGSNYLSTKGVYINTKSLQLYLDFTSHKTLSDISNKESSMGYLSKVPLECFQEVIYLNGSAQGSLNNESINGDIYIEKTYGSKFPVQWIWIQSSHSKNKASLSFSVGKIPFFGIKIKGFLCVLYADNKLYHFYTGNLSKLRVHDNKILIKRGKYKLILTPTSSDTVTLVGPSKNAKMILDVFESLTASCTVELYENNNCIYTDTFSNVGYENMW